MDREKEKEKKERQRERKKGLAEILKVESKDATTAFDALNPTALPFQIAFQLMLIFDSAAAAACHTFDDRPPFPYTHSVVQNSVKKHQNS